MPSPWTMVSSSCWHPDLLFLLPASSPCSSLLLFFPSSPQSPPFPTFSSSSKHTIIHFAHFRNPLKTFHPNFYTITTGSSRDKSCTPLGNKLFRWCGFPVEECLWLAPPDGFHTRTMFLSFSSEALKSSWFSALDFSS